MPRRPQFRRFLNPGLRLFHKQGKAHSEAGANRRGSERKIDKAVDKDRR